MTGNVDRAAMAPARWAAIPAAATITLSPLDSADWANSSATAGVRWAEMIRTVGSMPNSRSWAMQLSMTFRSLSEPMTTATGVVF